MLAFTGFSGFSIGNQGPLLGKACHRNNMSASAHAKLHIRTNVSVRNAFALPSRSLSGSAALGFAGAFELASRVCSAPLVAGHLH